MFNDMMNNMSNDEKSEFRNFMNQLKEGMVSMVLDDIGSELKYDDEPVLMQFVLITNTPLIFDLFKAVIKNGYCGDSTQIEKLIDDLKDKTEKIVEKKGLPW